MPSKLFPNLSYEKSKKVVKSKKFETKSELIRNNLFILILITLIATVILIFFKIPLSPIIIMIIALNIGSLLLMGLDKTYSRSINSTRIPETFFYLISLIGGSIGVIIGSQFFRHKTIKMQFLMWPILILVIQAIVILIWIV